MAKINIIRSGFLFLFLNMAMLLLGSHTPYYFKHINTEDGLSQSSVLCIIQDKQGFIWIGTNDGINKYNGSHFKTYSTDNTNGNIQDCVINTLYEASNGNIWIGTNKGVSIYNPRYESFTKFDLKIQDNEMRRAIKSITQDQKGRIWIADFYRGIYRYTPDSKELIRIKKSDSKDITLPQCIHIDTNGTIWVGSVNQGLFLFDEKLNKFIPFKASNQINLERAAVNTITSIGNDIYLAINYNALFKFDNQNKEIIKVPLTNSPIPSLGIRTIQQVNTDELWIGTNQGVFIYNIKDQTDINIKASPLDKYSLADNSVHSLYKDRDGGIWVGGYFGGISYLPYLPNFFNKYYPFKNDTAIKGKVIRNLKLDNQGYIWIATEDAGLSRFNPKTKTFRNFTSDDGAIRALEIDGEDILMGGNTNGIKMMDTKTEKYKDFPSGKNISGIYCLLRDKAGNIWAGKNDGVYICYKNSGKFEKLDSLGNFFIHDIHEDYLGNIWLAAISSGVICYNPQTKESTRYTYDPNNETSVITKVLGIFEDSKKRTWFMSEGWAICRFERETKTFKRYTLKDGLPNSVVYSMTEDENQNLWFGTNKGLVRFNPDNNNIKVYTTQDGLLSGQFNYKSALLNKNDSLIYMGTTEGLISFNPSLFNDHYTNYSTPTLTSFQILHENIGIGEDSPLKESISMTQAIRLKYNQNSFSFDFVTLDYNASANNYYTYKLEGFDDKWLSIEDGQKINYAKLPPGEYILKIRKNNTVVRHLNITITPPLWLSNYAFGLYAILAILLMYYSIKKTMNVIRAKHLKSLHRMEARKEKELYDAKITFFTNITHEIRTPLTLIKVPLENILKTSVVDDKTKEDLQIMKRNTDHLHTLVNQLLDFRKAESEKFDLNISNQDVISAIKELVEMFSPAFEQKNLQIETDLPETPLFVDLDQNIFSKIMNNLLSNALKFASTSIGITFIKEEKSYQVIIKNDGEIIKEEDFDKVFDPFYQIKKKNDIGIGTGIGLSLSSNLAEVHGGRLYIKRESLNYNTLVLELPIHQPVTTNKLSGTDILNSNSKTDEIKIPVGDELKNKYQLLIVEDNPEMLSFIQKQLNSIYIVHTATNGEEALQVMEKELIDLVVSDVAMPIMDGFSLLQNIKQNIKYCHIPVVLLTARTNIQEKIEGVELGADAYIEKPFSLDFLFAQIENLLNNRKMLRNLFITSPHIRSNSITITKADEDYIEEINKHIQTHIENPEFDVDELVLMMNTSRSSLLRKIKGIAGITVNEYIRLIRLKKAAELLEDGRYRINEICSMTGFNSTSYFAKCFQKQFGILPKDFIKKK